MDSIRSTLPTHSTIVWIFPIWVKVKFPYTT